MSQAHIGYLVKLISDRTKIRVDASLESVHLTTTQSRVLGYLSHHQNRAAQKEIADFLNVSHPTVVGVINRLEQAGFVERQADPDDRRNRIIRATDRAAQIGTLLEANIEKNEAYMLRGFSEKEVLELRRMLERVASNLELPSAPSLTPKNE